MMQNDLNASHSSSDGSSANRLWSFFQHAPGMIAMLSGPEHVYEFANPAYLDLIGRRDVIGQKVRDVAPELEQQGTVALLDKVYSTGEPFIGRRMPIGFQRQADAPPQLRYIDFVYQPVTDDQGRVTGIFAQGFDVTEHIQAQTALRESEERYRVLFEQAAVGVAHTNLDGRWVMVNQKLCDILGYSHDELISRTFQSVTDPDDLKDDLPLIKALNAGELPSFRREKRYIRKDGSIIWVEISVSLVRDPSGAPDYWVVIIQDVQDRKVAEQTRRESEERLSTALQIAALGTFDWDLRDNSVRSSEQTRIIFGFQDGEGNKAEDYFSRIVAEDVDRVQSEIKGTYRGSGRLETEYRIRLPNGSIRHVASLSQLYRDAQGQPEREVGIFDDITENKLWEERQRLLINELNHRVKNTLATVQSIAAQTFRDVHEESRPKLKAFEERLFALARAHDVLTRENWEGAELREIIAEVLEPYRRLAGERFVIRGPHLRLSPSTALALAMALHELATNASKYGALSTSRGRVSILWTLTSGDSPTLNLEWRESHGPSVLPPTRRGFGTRLIERSLASDLGGNVRLIYDPSGVICVVEAPLKEHGSEGHKP
jgi:PAS domain S-box-containing protein